MEETTYPNALVTHQKERKLTYVYLKPELRKKKGWVKQIVEIAPNVNLDIDENGEVGGIEIT